MMKYLLVREDQALPEIRDALIESKKFISSRELILMNSAARKEFMLGHKFLNDTLLSVTEEHSNRELAAQLDGHNAKKD